MNIVVPMAGLGKRFSEVGYTVPKPLIPVRDGKSIIEMVLDGLNLDGQYIFIVQKQHCEQFQLDMILQQIKPGCIIIPIDFVTQGQLCTVLLAESYINTGDSLLICNCDVNVNWNAAEFLEFSNGIDASGVVVTTPSKNPEFSYVRTDADGKILESAEKRIISSHGNVGVFYWSSGTEFVHYANLFIDKNERVNNEFYIAPMHNIAIEHGLEFYIYEIYSSLSYGTPRELSENS